jgi:FkbM family methyltransferase
MFRTAQADMTISKIIHFAIPADPAAFQVRNIEIARELHPGWKFIIWQESDDRAAYVLSKYWDRANSPQQLANLISLEAVLQHGGFYVDSSISLRKNLDALRSYSFVIASQDGSELCTKFFGAVAQHPALKHLVDELATREIDWTLPDSATTGSKFVTREIKWRDDVTVIPRETFYPRGGDCEVGQNPMSIYGAPCQEASGLSSTKSRRSETSFRRNLFQRIRYLLFKLRRRLKTDVPRAYPASGVICVETIHGNRMFLLGEDASVTPEIALHGTYEFDEERFMQRVIRPGDWAIDVGANVGVFSLLLAQFVGPFGKVFCYEPNPLPASLLKKSLLMNWLHDRADVRQKAVGSTSEVVRLRFSKERLGDATLTLTDGGTFESTLSLLGDVEEIDVEVTTLDADFPVDLPIRLLKIDAEGYDHQVLQGSARLLQRQCIDIVMLECLQEVHGWNWPEYLSKLRQIMDFGYGLYTLTVSSKLQQLSLKQLLLTDRARNIFLVSKYAAATFKELK